MGKFRDGSHFVDECGILGHKEGSDDDNIQLKIQCQII